MTRTNDLPTLKRRRPWAQTAIALALGGTLMLSGCGTGNTAPETAEASNATHEPAAQTSFSTGDADWDSLIDIAGMDFEYTDRDKDPSFDRATATIVELTGNGAKVTQGDGATVDGSTVTLAAEKTFILSGNLTDGQVVVDVADNEKVQVVFDGATIHNNDGAALLVESADKVFVTLAEGSVNRLTDGGSYDLAEGEDEPNAVLFSKDDLTINGSGKLTVEGTYRHGINSKDDLVITGGDISVTAAEDALRGKDCVKILDGRFDLESGEDGIESSNDSDPTRGFVSIDGGEFTIDCDDDGMQAATYLRIAGGKGDIASGDHALRSEIESALMGGDFTVAAGGKGMNAETRFTMDGGALDVRKSTEGIEAQQIIVNDGDLSIVASDDGMNAAVAERDSNDNATGTSTGASAGNRSGSASGGGAQGQGRGRFGDMPQNGEEPPAPPDGEMPQGDMPQRGGKGGRGMQDGTMPEGEMPQGEMPQGGRGGMGGFGGMGGTVSEDCLIRINGGTVSVDAQGDAVDSNGYIEINGGVVEGIGSANSGNGALDTELGSEVNGGTVFLAGMAGMAESFGSGSSQPFAMVMASGQAGDTVAILDAQGKEIASWKTPRAFQCVLVSSPELKDGSTYTLKVGSATTQFTASTQSTGMGGMGQGGRGMR